jgi:hypothetical protein
MRLDNFLSRLEQERTVALGDVKSRWDSIDLLLDLFFVRRDFFSAFFR